MTTGTGIAIAGIWVFVGMLAKSETITAIGFELGIVIACTATTLLAWLT